MFIRRALFIGLLGLTFSACDKVDVKLFAQSFPTTVHAQFTPSPASENVTGYRIVLNGAAPFIAPPSVCSATVCSVVLNIPSAGNYSVAVNAQNLQLSTTPASTQNGPVTTTTFSINLAPGALTNQTVTP